MILIAVVAAWLLAEAGPVTGAEPPARTASEYQVKAAFVYNFAKFVEWPPPVDGPAGFCVFGEATVFSALEQVVRGKLIAGRTVEVKRLKQVEDPRRECQILFIAGGDAGSAQERAAALAEGSSAGVLTIGESDGFLESGGIINFLLKDKKVRFEINLAAARKARLTISSKLLQLAADVRGDAESGK
ncbi:MAG: YfiR family protein [Bryobacteraceae bacterium]